MITLAKTPMGGYLNVDLINSISVIKEGCQYCVSVLTADDDVRFGHCDSKEEAQEIADAFALNAGAVVDLAHI